MMKYEVNNKNEDLIQNATLFYNDNDRATEISYDSHLQWLLSS